MTDSTEPNKEVFTSLHDLSAITIPSHIISQNPILSKTKELLDMLSADHIRKLITDMLAPLADTDFYKRFFAALKENIKNNPWQTGMFVVGVILMLNPIALLGFGALGPVAGSVAAAWMSALGGNVAAGSAYAILQSIGMTYAIVFPVVGAAIAGAAVATNSVMQEGGKEIHKWAKGDYGEPVKEWMEGKYGNPVSDWWGGKFGNPVSDWFNAHSKKE